MIEWLTPRGVTFLNPLVYLPQPNSLGTSHATWLTGIWRHLPQGRPRKFPAGLDLSEEVVFAAPGRPPLSPIRARRRALMRRIVCRRTSSRGGPSQGVTVV